MLLTIKYEYEDMLKVDITKGMYLASIVDIVRIYPYVVINGNRYYLEKEVDSNE